MAAGEKVAVLPVRALLAVLGDGLEVRKSQREGKRYPLYLVTPWGPWPINTPAGQDFILENAKFNGAPAPDNPEPEPEKSPEPAPPAPEPEPGEIPEKSGFSRFWEGLGSLD